MNASDVHAWAKAFRAFIDTLEAEYDESETPAPRESRTRLATKKSRRAPMRQPEAPDASIEVSEMNRHRALRGLRRAGYFPESEEGDQ